MNIVTLMIRGFVWNLYNKNGSIILKEYGDKSMDFYDNQREIDTTFLIGGRQRRRLYQLNLMVLYLYQLYIILPFMETVDLN